MCGPVSTPKLTKQLGSTSNDYVVMAVTPWLLRYGVGTSGLRVLDEIRALSGNYRHKVAWRTADVSKAFPNAWNFSTNIRTNNGINTEQFTATADTLWVQAGLAVSASGVSPEGEALASVQAMVPSVARIAAARNIEVQPVLNTSESMYVPIGQPFAALSMDSAMFALVANGVSGTISYQPAIRYGDRSDDMGAWTDLGTSQSFTANGRANSGNISITPDVNMWAQAGLKITATGRGTIQTAVAVKY